VDLLGFIDSAFIEDDNGEQRLFLDGWVVGVKERLLTVELRACGQSLLLNRLLERPDVAQRLPHIPQALFAGFKVSFKLPQGEVPSHLTLRAATAGGSLLQGEIPIENIAGSLTENTERVLFGDPAARRNLRQTLHKELQEFLVSGEMITLPEAAEPEISVILVCRNQASATLRCLRALSTERTARFEVLLADNNSTDETSTLLDRVSGLQLLRLPENRQFIAAANQAAAQARSSALLFLNNDCFVEFGCLNALQETLNSLPDVGAVGGRLLRADMTLQEAGGIVWGDGATSGYGMGDQPAAAQYLCRREVDYCSGALLLIRRSAFESAGGFSQVYRNAYYEDVDLCFRVRDLGYRVMYEPKAVALHVQRASGNTGEIGEDQLLNRQKFCRRFSGILSHRPFVSVEQELELRSTGGTGCRILLIHRGAGNIKDIDNMRLAFLLETLARHLFEVSLVTVFPFEADQLPGIEMFTGGDIRCALQLLRERERFYGAVILLDSTAAELYMTARAPLAAWPEEPAIFTDPAAADEYDRRLLSLSKPLPPLDCLPDFALLADRPRSKTLFFVDADEETDAEWAQQLLRQPGSASAEAATLVLLGTKPLKFDMPGAALQRNPSSAELLALLASHRLACSNAQDGRRTAALLAAVSAHTPLVLTSKQTDALGWLDGEHVLVADSIEEFQCRSKTLANEPERGRAMAEAAWKASRRVYSAAAVERRLLSVLHTALRRLEKNGNLSSAADQL
jgi:GT2 family glycosyltransferase